MIVLWLSCLSIALWFSRLVLTCLVLSFVLPRFCLSRVLTRFLSCISLPYLLVSCFCLAEDTAAAVATTAPRPAISDEAWQERLRLEHSLVTASFMNELSKCQGWTCANEGVGLRLCHALNSPPLTLNHNPNPNHSSNPNLNLNLNLNLDLNLNLNLKP